MEFFRLNMIEWFHAAVNRDTSHGRAIRRGSAAEAGGVAVAYPYMQVERRGVRQIIVRWRFLA
jgi:hypothetical protein